MTSGKRPKPSVFISYAHKDGMEFTRRVAFALSMYSHVFFDLHLQAGDYPSQLYEEIRTRDYFLFIMSPYSLASEWCGRELECAQQYKDDRIMLAKIYPGFGDKELEEKYTFGDFTEDFEQGFRRLTAMMLGKPYSSWEYIAKESDEQVIESLQEGLIPALIAKRIAEWVLADRLWPHVENYIEKREQESSFHFFKGHPRTPRGILRQCQPIREQFAKFLDQPGVVLINSVIPIVEKYLDDLSNASDTDHQQAGETAFSILTDVFTVLQTSMAANLNATGLASVQKYFYFDVVEKLREFLNEHARRSRFLY